ncbi:MAG: hypothetical protein FWH53_02035 [Leptospirales bacterium]|nr:hypothetical protein [Leptospirales bacterium]
MLTRIKETFKEILINSLNTQQINYLGTLSDHSFDLYRESGFTATAQMQEQTAVDILLDYFKDDNDIVRLFSIMLRHEGEHFHNNDLAISDRDEFISLIKHDRWVYDRDLKVFLYDHFYERDINFFKNIQTIDLRYDIDINKLIDTITSESKSMSAQDIEWNITMRLYDLETHIEEPIKIIIDLLLSQKDLQSIRREIFFCLKELAINASKANYKLLFEKYFAPQLGVHPDEDYNKFLELFKDEIAKNGNKKFLELAKRDDQFYTITFQSTVDSIKIWVTNAQNVTLIEKAQILKNIYPKNFDEDYFSNDDINKEGAGLGLNLITNILKQYTRDPNPLKGVFYDDFIRMGFVLKYSETKISNIY